jgi:hypothetical protein
MLILFFSLNASQEVIGFGQQVEDTFDLTRCTSYFLPQPLFPTSQIPEKKEHVVTLYLPHTCWSSNRYSWDIESGQNMPDNPTLECFVITNGSEGKKLFFEDLERERLDCWNKIDRDTLQQPSFHGYAHTDGQTLALVGLYKELSPNPLIGSKFTVCGIGGPYVRNKERAAQDVETRQHWQHQLGKGSIVVVYPAGGISYGSSQHASANF